MPVFSGVWTAIVTPFKDGVLDENTFERHVEFQVAGGVDGIMPASTTSEAITMSREERLREIELAIKFAKGRIGVIAGTGSSNTAEVIAFTREVEKLGVQGCLVNTPAYNKPSQEGLFQHFKAIAAATKLPVMVYNVPSRSVVNLLPETVARIADACPNVVAIKEASGNIVQISNVKRLAPRIDLLSGDDGMTLPVLVVGGVGIVSVLSNVVPKQIGEVIKLYNKGDLTGARKVHERLLPLFDAMFAETSPSPVKYAASKLGFGDGSVRLPLVPCTEPLRKKIDAILKDLGLL
ncbi:MAG: 4-hydroxy-tetrahydrodipicolinate synthase [Planctomycetaceae bacterium]|nr:4-hydroxy-tetrahydrodipicolinate synthase [Planctomycetaceae bacterium]